MVHLLILKGVSPKTSRLCGYEKKNPDRNGLCINVKFAKRLRAIVDNNINLTE